MIVKYKEWELELAWTIRQVMKIQEGAKDKDVNSMLLQIEIFNKNRKSGPEITIDNFTDEDLATVLLMKEEQSKNFLVKK